VLVDIYEKDISRLKTGIAAHVAVNALPHKAFRGRIAYVGDVVDERTRTVKTRVTIENEGGLLKPGMFATVSIDSIADPRFDRVIAVPEEGVLIDGTARYVFIRIGEGTFKRRDVVLGRTLGKKVQVLEGLNESDPLVVKGLFALKSEYKKELLRVE
jgi:cobalt-zinc-cadmium efflux system membrane fusion protein